MFTYSSRLGNRKHRNRIAELHNSTSFFIKKGTSNDNEMQRLTSQSRVTRPRVARSIPRGRGRTSSKPTNKREHNELVRSLIEESEWIAEGGRQGRVKELDRCCRGFWRSRRL